MSWNSKLKWWRELESQDFGAHGELTEPYETAAKIIGITFATHDVKLMGGNTRSEPDIRWSGFSSQGDGASFVGSYEYAKGSAKGIRAEFPTDVVLHKIADELATMQKNNGYKVTARITQGGHYVHKYTMDAEVFKGDDYAPEDVHRLTLETMRAFAQWIYDGLQAEYEYRLSDENVDESIRANEYEFLEDGSIT